MDALRRLRGSMRPRAGTYSDIDGTKEKVAWYWRAAGIGASFMILGGFAMTQVELCEVYTDNLSPVSSCYKALLKKNLI